MTPEQARKRKHHGEWHKSLIHIEDLIAKLRAESLDDPSEKPIEWVSVG